MTNEERPKRAAIVVESGGTVFAKGASVRGWDTSASVTGADSYLDLSDAKADGTIEAREAAVLKAERIILDADAPTRLREEVRSGSEDKHGTTERMREWVMSNISDPIKLEAWLKILDRMS